MRTHDDFERMPVLSSDERLMVQAELQSMVGYFTPAPRGDIAGVLSELNVLPRKREGDSEAEFKLEIYIKALSDLPRWTIRRAVDEITKTEDWFPQPSKIRRSADKHLSKARWRKHCLEQALRRADGPTPDDIVTPEQAAAILVEFGLKRDPVAMAQNDERAA